MPARAGLLLLLVLVVLGLVHRALWGDLQGFVEGVDHHPRLIQDYLGHYQPMAARILDDPRPVHGYFYPAAFALLLHPLAVLPVGTGAALWLLLVIGSLALLHLASARALRLSPEGQVGLLLIEGLSFPLLHTLKWGQVSALLVAFALLAWTGSARAAGAGLWLSLGAAIKLYPLAFTLPLLLVRRGRALAVALAGAVALLVLLPALVLGPARWWTFEREVGRAARAAQVWVAQDENSQHLPHLAGRLWRLFSTAPAPDLEALSVLCALGLALLTRRLHRQGEPIERLGLPLLAGLPLLLPTGWPHYFAGLPFAQAALLQWGWAERGRACGRLRLLFGATSALLASAPVVVLVGGWSRYNLHGGLVAATLLLLGGLLPARARP